MNENWNENWKEFRIGDLFDIRPTMAKKLSGDTGSTPVLSNTSANNGIKYYASESPTENGNVITFSDTTDSAETVFYQSHDFIGFSHVQVMLPKIYSDEWNRQTYLFLISAFRRAIGSSFNYANKFNRTVASNIVIQLPVTSSGDPDFSYMEEQISKLEKERISELEAYLTATGLDDYELTDKDRKVLNEMKNRKKEFGEFRIGDMFDSVNGDTDLKKNDLEMDGIPIITAGLNNSGILGKTNKKAKIISENTITVDMFGYPFYRDFQYKMVTHARVFALIPKFQMTKRTGLYITSSLHFLKDKYSYNNMCSWAKIQNLQISLPVASSGTPDYEWMERYIRATEKKVIGKLYEYRGKEIDTAKMVAKVN